jgi:hypothetical protein
MQTKDVIRARVGIEPKEPIKEALGLASNNFHEEEMYPLATSVQDILDAPDVGELTFPVHEWKKRVTIRGLSREEFIRCKASATDSRDKLDEAKFEKALLIAAMVTPKINSGTVRDVYAKDVGAIGVIVKAIMSHLGADAESNKSDDAGVTESGDTL